MRKLSRAALAVIATVSLVALIIYRNEYNRLRHVLEVFNYFGHPGDKRLLVNCTDVFKTGEIFGFDPTNYDFGQPTPAWQRIKNDAYVYSAYALNSRKILAVGFAKIKAIEQLSCGIYYDNELKPKIGIFTHDIIEMSSSIDKNDNSTDKKIYSAYNLICTVKSPNSSEKRVVGVTFADREQLFDNAVVFTVKSLIRDNETKNFTYEFAMCVAPTESRVISNDDMIDFISFHHSIGIRHFVVYNFGISQKFTNALKKISEKLNFSYTTIPWNFPFVEVSKDVVGRVVRADCRYRTYKNVEFGTTLTWNDYIILGYHRNVNKLFIDVDQVGLIADRYKISTRMFCIEREDAKSNATIVDVKPNVFASETFDVARSINFFRSGPEKTMNFDDDDDDGATTREITSDVIIVNRYEKNCNHSLNLISSNDPWVGKFAKNIRDLPINKLYRTYGN